MISAGKYQKLLEAGTSPSDKDLQNQIWNCGELSGTEVNLGK